MRQPEGPTPDDDQPTGTPGNGDDERFLRGLGSEYATDGTAARHGFDRTPVDDGLVDEGDAGDWERELDGERNAPADASHDAGTGGAPTPEASEDSSPSRRGRRTRTRLSRRSRGARSADSDDAAEATDSGGRVFTMPKVELGSPFGRRPQRLEDIDARADEKAAKARGKAKVAVEKEKSKADVATAKTQRKHAKRVLGHNQKAAQIDLKNQRNRLDDEKAATELTRRNSPEYRAAQELKRQKKEKLEEDVGAAAGAVRKPLASTGSVIEIAGRETRNAAGAQREKGGKLLLRGALLVSQGLAGVAELYGKALNRAPITTASATVGVLLVQKLTRVDFIDMGQDVVFDVADRLLPDERVKDAIDHVPGVDFAENHQMNDPAEGVPVDQIANPSEYEEGTFNPAEDGSVDDVERAQDASGDEPQPGPLSEPEGLTEPPSDADSTEFASVEINPKRSEIENIWQDLSETLSVDGTGLSDLDSHKLQRVLNAEFDFYQNSDMFTSDAGDSGITRGNWEIVGNPDVIDFPQGMVDRAEQLVNNPDLLDQRYDEVASSDGAASFEQVDTSSTPTNDDYTIPDGTTVEVPASDGSGNIIVDLDHSNSERFAQPNTELTEFYKERFPGTITSDDLARRMHETILNDERARAWIDYLIQENILTSDGRHTVAGGDVYIGSYLDSLINELGSNPESIYSQADIDQINNAPVSGSTWDELATKIQNWASNRGDNLEGVDFRGAGERAREYTMRFARGIGSGTHHVWTFSADALSELVNGWKDAGADTDTTTPNS